ncbi:MAG: hypothetical protein KGJ02_02030 [Verrucomicrobiota bacterium]|nr:hypothetical protein [Verrucomicrobiota bacterium]
MSRILLLVSIFFSRICLGSVDQDSNCLQILDEPRPKGRGMIWEEFRTPPKFGCELPGPKGPGFWRPDEPPQVIQLYADALASSEQKYSYWVCWVSNCKNYGKVWRSVSSACPKCGRPGMPCSLQH